MSHHHFSVATAKVFALFIAVVISGFASAVHALDAPRVALVLGNGAYPSRLANPVRDAQAVAVVLRSLGFEVMERRDLSRDAMLRAVVEFEDRISGKNALAFVFYAGHAMQLDGESMLLPVDTEVSGARDARVTAVPLDRVVKSLMRAKPAAAIVVLDACRDNPFAPAVSGGKRGLAGLLSSSPSNLMLQYATAPGQIAADEQPGSRHSPFTTALLEHLGTAGVDIHEVFRRIRRDVQASTAKQGQQQQPWESTSLTMPIVLSPRRAVAGNAANEPSSLKKSQSRQVMVEPVTQEGTAASRLLLKLLDQTANRGQRVRKIYEFVDQGLADDGLDADTISKAVMGLAPRQRSDMIQFLSMFLEEINGRQLHELAGDGEDRAFLLDRLADFLSPKSLDAKDVRQLTAGLSGAPHDMVLARLAPYVRGPVSLKEVRPATR
jgi:hypothetical protein